MNTSKAATDSAPAEAPGGFGNRRLTSIAFWILKVLLAAMFISAGTAKLVGVTEMVRGFEQLGLGQWFRYFTGGYEVVASILLLVPSTMVFGAFLLLFVCVGALYVQVFLAHGDLVHVLVPLVAFAAISWTRRAQLFALVFGSHARTS